MTINAEQLLFILENTPPQQNIMLVGRHGIGKSQILEDFFQKKGFKVTTLFLGQMSDPGDLIGLPEKNSKTGRTDFMLPYWFPVDEKPIVLFLDELNRARPEVLQTVMDLTLNRKLAGKSLPKGSRIISAVNGGDEYQLTDLDPALISRFNIYEFAPSVEDWLSWANKSGVDSRVVSFIKENPEFLDSADSNFEAEQFERAPDRRSWVRVSDVILKFPVPEAIHKTLISGIVGNRAANAFFQFLQDSIPSASQILLNGIELFKSQLEKLSLPEFSKVNESLFRFIESCAYSSDCIQKIARSLEDYFNFLAEKNLKEVQSHFVSICNGSVYPKTLVFIMENIPDFYKTLSNFLEEN